MFYKCQINLQGINYVYTEILSKNIYMMEKKRYDVMQ